MKKLVALMIALGFATTAHSADITGKVSVDMTENTANDYIATKKIEMGIAGDSGVGFGSIAIKTDANDDVILDKYHLGANLSETSSVQYGKQGDIFLDGGLEVVGNNKIANPSDLGESIIGKMGNFQARAKFTDTGTDVTDFDTIQATYSTTVSKFTLGAGVDHTISTDDNIYAGTVAFDVAEGMTLSTVATHDSSLANEVAYESMIKVGSLSAYVDGDEGDWSQNVGAGYKSTWKDLTWYVEANYNLDSEETTPAMGVSLLF